MRKATNKNSFFVLFIVTALFLFLLSGVLLQLFFDDKLPAADQNKQTYLRISTSNLLKIVEQELPLFAASIHWEDNSIAGSENDRTLLGSLLTFFQPEYNGWLRQELLVFSFLSNGGQQGREIGAYQDMVIESFPDEIFFQAEKNNPAVVANNSSSESSNNGQAAVPVTTGNSDVVYIYHTHNRESFLPELDTGNPNEAFDPIINVTLIGNELGKELKKLGIGNRVSAKDYWTELPDYSLSYKYSLQTVRAALQGNRDYKYVFDIHRDANSREKTTRTINGEDYGAVFFVIGMANKNYELNKEFALEIHQSLEKLYPGLSKGISEKEQTSGTNGEYNQSISPYALTIEVGGVYNTLEEELRSARALGEAIANVYWQAEKVNATQ